MVLALLTILKYILDKELIDLIIPFKPAYILSKKYIFEILFYLFR